MIIWVFLRFDRNFFEKCAKMFLPRNAFPVFPRTVDARETARQKGGDDWVGFWGEQPIRLPTLLLRGEVGKVRLT